MAQQPAQAPLPAQSAPGTLSSTLIMAPNMKMDQPRSFATPGVPVDGAGAVTHGMETSVTAEIRRPPCPVKVAVRHKNAYRKLRKRKLWNKTPWENIELKNDNTK